MSRRYVAPQSFISCKHLRQQDACALCARDELPTLIGRLERAVGAGRTSDALESTGGGTPSWELVNVAALSLLQDMQRARWTGSDGNVLNWHRRAKVILGDAFAAYTPLVRVTDDEKERGKPIQCPRVITAPDKTSTRCTGVLQVHRDSDPRSDDYAKPTVVRCSHNATHEWPRKAGGFLRLRVELDAVGHIRFSIDAVA